MAHDNLANRTVERAAAALKSGRAIGLPDVIRLIQRLSSDANEVDVSQLADVIQKDPVILARVLGTARTIGYNHTGAEVTSIIQAIHVVGFARIRTLTMSLLIAEGAGGDDIAPEHRDAAAVSICAGFVAECVARHYPLLDREEAFICACLRNFGRIVLSAFLVDEYRVAERIGTPGSDDGFRQVFGLGPLELARRLLRAENLPEVLLAALAEATPQKLAAAAENPEEQLWAVCDFSGRLTEMGLAPAMDGEDSAKQMQRLVADYGIILPGLPEQVPQILVSAGVELQKFVSGRKLARFPSGSIAQFNRRAGQLTHLLVPPPPPAPGAAGPAGSANAAVSPEHTAPTEEEAGALWTAAITRFGEKVGGRTLSQEAVMAEAVQSVQQGLDTPEAVVFVGEPGRSEFSLAGGSGALYRSLAPGVKIYLGERTVLGVCLKYRESVLIRNSREEKILPHLPPWLKTATAPGAFVLFPMLGDRGLAGLVLVGWAEPRPIVIAPSNVRLVGALLALVSRYREGGGARRGGTSGVVSGSNPVS